MTPALAALSIYAGLLAFIGLWLLSNVAKRKDAAGVSIGDGGDKNVIRAARGQMNFVENVPMTLILLLLIALLGAPVWVMHLAGAALTIGRAFHAWHFIQDDAPAWQRATGMILCGLTTIGGAFGAIYLGITGLS